MACFLVTAAEAVVVTAAAKAVKHHETEASSLKMPEQITAGSADCAVQEEKVPFSRKLMWLAKLLWGGAFLLAFEHVWHGEVVPWFPFLTAAADPGDRAEMLHEMSTVGVTMAVIVTAVWVGMVLLSSALEKRVPVSAQKEVQ
ncbi:MAG: hypothetical protein ACI4LA_05295 [Emergencia sp.]